MKELEFLSDEVLSLMELREDVLFNKIPKEDVKYYIDEANRIGKSSAEVFKNSNLEEILKAKCIDVIIKESCEVRKLSLRGEIIFEDDNKKIIIYKDSIDQIYEVLKEYNFSLEEQDVYNMHLAHEFYHYLEYKNKAYTNDMLNKITVFSIGPLKRKATILKTRELAAHSFCKSILGLEFHPKLFDYMYLLKNNTISLEELKSYAENLSKEYL
ncbi:hypothetical protein SAMN05444401_3763 [Clostridium amylolyticum]|uniref:Uncharacterized protein n=1 Tax=Clostridium amylolyticum TaxID=1121298 RepID=A0A1M6LSM7_9CLOT|nr:hypothetical protein [Clostridium amylolyticum]SHJ74086.1 hypothetical protein SAMN05444401_3763 [Clostridium amylolyticum]